MTKAIPPKLYKYQSIGSGSHTIDNLKNGEIWFSKPNLLNDPFDMAIPLLINVNAPDEDYLVFYDEMMKRITEPAERRAASKLFSNGRPSPEFKAHINEFQLTLSQQKVIDDFSQRGIACFSRRKDSILMWSHYAEGHKGLCLEFDTNYPPFQDKEKLHRVIYNQRYPSVSPAAVIRDKYLPITPLITKSIGWKYEKEWRLIMEKGNNVLKYDPNALAAIYFGCSMQDDLKKSVASMLFMSSVQLFNMKRSSTEFKLDIWPYTG